MRGLGTRWLHCAAGSRRGRLPLESCPLGARRRRQPSLSHIARKVGVLLFRRGVDGYAATQPKLSNVLSTYGEPHGASRCPTRSGLRLGPRRGVGRADRPGPGRGAVPGAAEPPVRGRAHARPPGRGRDRARGPLVPAGAPPLPAAAGHPTRQARPRMVPRRHRGGLPGARRLPRPPQRGHRTAPAGPRGRRAAVFRGLRGLPPRRQPVRRGARARRHRLRLRRRAGPRAPLVPDGHAPVRHPAHPRRRTAPAPAEGAGAPAVRAPAPHPAAGGRPAPLPRRHRPLLPRVGAVPDPPRARRGPAQPRRGRRDPTVLRGGRRLPAGRRHRGARHRPRRDRARAGNRRAERGKPDARRPAGARCTEHRHTGRAALSGGLEVAGRPPRRPAGTRRSAGPSGRGPRTRAPDGGARRPEGCRGGAP